MLNASSSNIFLCFFIFSFSRGEKKDGEVHVPRASESASSGGNKMLHSMGCEEKEKKLKGHLKQSETDAEVIIFAHSLTHYLIYSNPSKCGG
jgi:hypothetical protein